jgi:hypothetical protein
MDCHNEYKGKELKRSFHNQSHRQQDILADRAEKLDGKPCVFPPTGLVKVGLSTAD